MNKTPIIIINWNGIQDTIECIKSVVSMKGIYFHIHLIDNASDNNEGDQLNSLFAKESKLTFYQYPKNYGFSKAHIKIWEEVLIHLNSSYIALLNNDTIVDQNWLYEMISFAQSNKVDMVSSKMINFNNRDLMDNAGHKMLNTGEIIPVGHALSIHDYNSHQINMGACAGASLYRSSMIKKIGFFDSFFSTGYEDAEFGLRAVVCGFLCMYNPKAIVYHKGGASIRKIFNQDYSVMIQTSILYSYFKLVPFQNIIFSFPSIILKNFSIVIVDIVFRRWNYLQIWKQSWFNIFLLRKLIFHKRREFYRKQHSIISSRNFSKKTIFFLKFDLIRFWKFIILKEQSSIDKY